jgi:hypothetical protein
MLTIVIIIVYIGHVILFEKIPLMDFRSTGGLFKTLPEDDDSLEYVSTTILAEWIFLRTNIRNGV